ncbi:MAG: carboxypeptidase [Phycisphaerae bacterium]|nr:carboxypeptidase [Phycisphaerae bacterium]
MISSIALLHVLVISASFLQATAPSVPPGALPAEEQTDRPADKKPPPEDALTAPVRVVADAAVSSTDTVTINGSVVPYRVTVGTQPVWDIDNKPIASMFYTFYERTDVTDKSTRPLLISFNGGPGSASVWMHIAYTGPRILKIDSEGFPIQPYGIQENPHSILDVADIVYIDPVNTGFSRILNDARRELFFGVIEDVTYLARWIGAFVTRNGRWTSPKYVIGESYGTTRAAGLAARLQSSQWMYLNGVILVSPTDLGIRRDGVVDAAIPLPYYAATAWYHKALAPDLQQLDLDQLLPQVEAFTIDQLLPAMTRGGSLEPARRDELITQYARYSGLKPEAVRHHHFAVPPSFFWKELLRDKGLTIGRLDSRYRGLDSDDAGDRPDFDPAMSAWNHAFAPAINYYLRDVPAYKTDLQYWLFGPVRPWNQEDDRTGENLRSAIAENPYLHVLVQSGYYDGATNYFDAKFTMWNMDPAGRFQDRLTWKGYRSGHMMYLRREDAGRANDDIRAFIARTMPREGQPAKR